MRGELMNVPTEGHRKRMRQRMRQMRIESLRSQDVLEFILYYALPRRDTKPQAYELLQKFGTMEAVLKADPKDLMTIKGIGPRAAQWLNRIGKLIDSYGELEPIDKPMLGNLSKAIEYFDQFFADKEEAQVWQFCLNAGGRLIGCMKIADYACWRVEEYLRAALEQAIFMEAHSVLLCFYTGGKKQPVDDDERAAIENYGYSLSVTGIRLLDHIVYSREGVESMVRNRTVYGELQTDMGELAEMMCDNAMETGYLEEWIEK